MRRFWLLAMFALAGYAGGQQPGAATQASGTPAANAKAATAGGGAKAAPDIVKVYEPRKPVIEPRLLPPAEPLDFPKDCTNESFGESEVSLLVDTEGRPRNVMFLKPSGTIAD